MKMHRRKFLACAAAVLGHAATSPRGPLMAANQSSALQVTIDPQRVLGTIPPDFIGLGYEISSVARAGLLSAQNTRYVRYVRALGPQGVIRVGGNTSDYATYSAAAEPVSAPTATVVNRAVLDDLGGFLEATGWKLIWGLDLGRGTPEQAVEEAQAVAAAARDRLLAMEIGNEPDLFGGVHRPKGYGYAEFLAEYRRFRDAIRAKLPDVPFAGPDAATKTDWVTRFAADEGGDLKLLTHHYYAEGPPKNPASTIENLLRGTGKLTRILEQCRLAAQSASLPYRICETNSCFGGGKPGVSDTFASSLWGLDYLFTLASANAGGVNLETGLNQLGFISYYSPIGDNEHGDYSAKPLYYAMKAFAEIRRGEMVQARYDAGSLNIKAYAMRGNQKSLAVALINKEAAQAVEVTIAGAEGLSSGSLLRLAAPSLESGEGVTLGGSKISFDGDWTAAKRERVVRRGGHWIVAVSPASAALVTLGV